jgi:hypothetical protein
MIKHIVLWTLKNRENQQSLEATAAGGIDFTKSADSWDVALYAELESREALAGYEGHPAHEAVKEFIGPSRQQRSLIDYEV